jgi:hypothetical protein
MRNKCNNIIEQAKRKIDELSAAIPLKIFMIDELFKGGCEYVGEIYNFRKTKFKGTVSRDGFGF